MASPRNTNSARLPRPFIRPYDLMGRALPAIIKATDNPAPRSPRAAGLRWRAGRKYTVYTLARIVAQWNSGCSNWTEGGQQLEWWYLRAPYLLICQLPAQCM